MKNFYVVNIALIILLNYAKIFMEPSKKILDLSEYIIEGPFSTNKSFSDISWEIMKKN